MIRFMNALLAALEAVKLGTSAAGATPPSDHIDSGPPTHQFPDGCSVDSGAFQ
jgi:hypothetical protein